MSGGTSGPVSGNPSSSGGGSSGGQSGSGAMSSMSGETSSGAGSGSGSGASSGGSGSSSGAALRCLGNPGGRFQVCPQDNPIKQAAGTRFETRSRLQRIQPQSNSASTFGTQATTPTVVVP